MDTNSRLTFIDGAVQFSQYYLKLPGDPTHLGIPHEAYITQNDGTMTNTTTRFYVPVTLTSDTITTLNNWEWGEWFPIITNNNKTIHYLGIYGSVSPDIVMYFTKDNIDLPTIIRNLKESTTTASPNLGTTTRVDNRMDYIAVGRAYQHTNQNKNNNYGYNQRSCGANIIHPKRNSINKTPNFVLKLHLDRELIQTKPNLSTIWSRLNDAHPDINTNIYLRRRINIQHVYYVICSNQNLEKGIKITVGSDTLFFTRIHPISTTFNYMGKIFYQLQEHDWSQLTTGTNNVSVLIPLVHEPYHSRLRNFLKI